MKKSNDFEIGNSNNYLRSSRNKSDDNPIISKITDYQTSISAFSTRIESKQNLNLSVELKEKRNKTQQKKKVEDDQTPDVPAIFKEWKKQEGLAW